MSNTQTPTQRIKIIGNTCGSTLGRSILNAGNVAIANVFRNIAEFFMSIGSGARGFNGFVSAGGVAATDAVTFSSFIAGNTVTINGVVFTGAASPASNVQWKVPATGEVDATTASGLAARINNTDGSAYGAPPAKVWGVVQAVAASNVVTLTAVEPGAIGNLYTLAISGNGSVTNATFQNGTDGTITYLSKGL
jgi:hypothetical protein